MTFPCSNYDSTAAFSALVDGKLVEPIRYM